MMMTPENLHERLDYWQRVLRLQDWDIEARFVRRTALGRPQALGHTRIDMYRRARVSIVDPIDYTEEDDWPIDRDSEATLVHELLHLHLDDLHVRPRDSHDQETAEWIALERAIETIARALLTIHRSNSTA